VLADPLFLSCLAFVVRQDRLKWWSGTDVTRHLILVWPTVDAKSTREKALIDHALAMVQQVSACTTMAPRAASSFVHELISCFLFVCFVCVVVLVVQEFHVGSKWLRKVYANMRNRSTESQIYKAAKRDYLAQQGAITQANNATLLQGGVLGPSLPKMSAQEAVSGASAGQRLASHTWHHLWQANLCSPFLCNCFFDMPLRVLLRLFALGIACVILFEQDARRRRRGRR